MDLGTLTYFLSLEIHRTPAGIHVCQRKYVLDLLKEFHLLDCKPQSTPMLHGSKFTSDISDEDPAFEDIEGYRSLIGKLLYITVTRPDISFSVHVLSQFMQQPKRSHYQAALRILRYLKTGPGLGLFYSANSTCSPVVYSDADWGSCPLSRKSVTGYLMKLGTSLITWKCKKQATVSRSSAESELRAMSSATAETLWVLSFLSDLHIHIDLPVPLYCDNQSALHITANPVFHERTKHLEVDCYFVREKFQAGIVKPVYISGKHQPADILTKALLPQHHYALVSKLGLRNPFSPSNLRGVCTDSQQVHLVQATGPRPDTSNRSNNKPESKYAGFKHKAKVQELLKILNSHIS